jgi:hypothetical protein
MKSLFAAAAIAALTLLTYFQFPGHTWLQQDTQIYAPMLEHFWDPTVLGKDILVQRPHVSFTLYDEIAVGLRKLTGLGFGEVLAGVQIATRALAIWGVFLMAAAVGLATGPALAVAAIFSLGASISGPSVLIFEIEPNPRGFAVPLLLMATGLIGHGRYFIAGACGAAAFLIHPPTVYPFWGVFFALALWPSQPDIMRRRLWAFLPLLAATVILLFASRYQAGAGETQMFFTRLEPLQEKLQRMRASYVWVSAWWRNWLGHYLFLYLLILFAYLRLRRRTPADLRVFLLGMPLVGLLSMPLSWLLLEKMKWALLPQFQPLRALLFVTAMAVFAAAAAGFKAIEARRYIEALLLFTAAYLIPVNTRVLAIPPGNRIATVAILAGGACVAGWAAARKRRWAPVALAAVALAGFFLLPTLGSVRSYPRLHTPEVAALSDWARTSTPKDAVFLFPDAGRGLAAGVFRSQALRAVYVDWKGGGQVNYLKELGEQWWSRWQKAMTAPLTAEQYRELGIDYLVVDTRRELPGATAVYQNSTYLVYRLP